MGQLGAERWEEVYLVWIDHWIYERWIALKEDENCVPFMYGSLYSTMGIVLYYLLRVEPYTSVPVLFQVEP